MGGGGHMCRDTTTKLNILVSHSRLSPQGRPCLLSSDGEQPLTGDAEGGWGCILRERAARPRGAGGRDYAYLDAPTPADICNAGLRRGDGADVEE